MGKSASKAKAAIDEGREEEFAAELRGDDGVIRLPYERAPPKPVDLNALLEKYPEGEDEESHKESLRGESEREAGSDAHDEFSPEGAYSPGSSGVGPCMDFKEKRPLRETLRGEEETGITGPDAEGMEVGSFSAGMAVAPGHSLQQRERRDAEGKTLRETLRAEEETGITGPGSEGIEEGSFSSDMTLVAGHSLQQRDIKMMKGSKEKENAEKDAKDKRALKEETVLTSVSTTKKPDMPEQGKKTNKGDDKLESDGKNKDNKKEVEPSDVSPVVVASQGMKDEDKHKDGSQDESEHDEITGTKRVKGDGERDKANRDEKDDADRSIREDVPDVVKDGESQQSSVTLSDIPELEDDIPSDASLSPRAAHRSSDDAKDKTDSEKDKGEEEDSKEKDQGNEERMEAVDLSAEGEAGTEDTEETDASKEPIMVNHFKEFLNMFRLGGRSKSQTSTDSVGGSVDLEDGDDKDKASEKEGESDTENQNLKSTDNAVAAMVGLHAHGGEVYEQLAEGDTQALSSLSARVKMLNQSQDNAENELTPGGVGPEQGALSAENVGYETAVMGSGPEHGLESGSSQGMGAQGGMKPPAEAATGVGGGKGQDDSQGETTMVDAGAGIRDDCLSEQVSVPISSLKSANLKEVEKQNDAGNEEDKFTGASADRGKGQDNKSDTTTGIDAEGILSEDFVSQPWFKPEDQANLEKKASEAQAKKGDTATTKAGIAKKGIAGKGLTKQKSKESQDTAKGGLSKQDSTQDKKTLKKSPSVGSKTGKESGTGKTTADKSKSEGSTDKKGKEESPNAEGKKGQDNKVGETAGINADGSLSEEFVSAPWFKSDDDKKATATQAKKGTKSDNKTTKVSAAKYGSAKKGLTSQKSKEGQDTAKGGLSKQDSTQDKKALNKSPSVGGKAGKVSETGKSTADKSKPEGSTDKKIKPNTTRVGDKKEGDPGKSSDADGKKGQDNKIGETAGVNADGSLSEEFVSQPWFNGSSSASSRAKPGEKEKGKTLKKSNSQEEKSGAKKLQRGSSKEGKEVGAVGAGKEASDEKVKKAKTNKLGSAPSIDHPEETLIATNKQPVSGAGAGKEDTGDKEFKGTGKHVERAPSVEHVEEYLPAPSTRALKLGKFGKMTPVEDEDDPSTSDDMSDKSKKDGSKGEEGGSKDPNGGKGSGQQGLSEEDEGVPPSPSDVSSQLRESISSIDDPASESYRKAQDTENKTSDDSANCLSDDTSLDSGVLLESPESPRDKDFEDRNQDGKDKKKLADQEQTEPQERKISATVLLENVRGQKARLISSDSLEGDQSIIEEGRWSQEVSLDSQSTLADDSLSREISFDDPDNTMGGSFDQEDGASEVSLTGASELNLDDLGIMYDDWGAPSGPERSLESRQDDRGIMMSDDEDDYEEEEEESNDEVFYNEEKGDQAGRRRRLTKQGSKDSTSSREGSLSSSSSNAKRRSKVRFSRNITPAWRGLKKLSAGRLLIISQLF